MTMKPIGAYDRKPSRWGLLPKGEPVGGICINCGNRCARGYEHCDDCLVRAVRGMFAVDRAVRSRKAPRLDEQERGA